MDVVQRSQLSFDSTPVELCRPNSESWKLQLERSLWSEHYRMGRLRTRDQEPEIPTRIAQPFSPFSDTDRSYLNIVNDASSSSTFIIPIDAPDVESANVSEVCSQFSSESYAGEFWGQDWGDDPYDVTGPENYNEESDSVPEVANEESLYGDDPYGIYGSAISALATNAKGKGKCKGKPMSSTREVEYRCFRCGRKGHIQSACPLRTPDYPSSLYAPA